VSPLLIVLYIVFTIYNTVIRPIYILTVLGIAWLSILSNYYLSNPISVKQETARDIFTVKSAQGALSQEKSP